MCFSYGCTPYWLMTLANYLISIFLYLLLNFSKNHTHFMEFLLGLKEIIHVNILVLSIYSVNVNHELILTILAGLGITLNV